ncbi:MAG TPA: hypothetical protein VGO16_13400 [Pseudonocardiaceae bacterium]|nr:hypothetical protein [Pseudonocardiaceae bacterium]
MSTDFADPLDPVPGTDDASGMAVQRALCAAERLLSARLGARVQLADPEHLGGSGRSTVVRVRVAHTPFTLPRTLVVKHSPAPAPVGGVDPFALEAASCQLFTALLHEDLRHQDRPGPELIACDRVQRLLVLEDLGRSGTVASLLYAADASRAEQALLNWAHALGRLHATTRDRETDFAALLRRLGAARIRDPIAEHGRAAVTGLPALLETELEVASPPDAVAEARRAAEMLDGHPHRAFSPADLGPDNAVVAGKTVRFIDFEGGGFRTALLNTAQLRAPLPWSPLAFTFPPGMAEAMVSAWHAEVVGSWPKLNDRSVLTRRLLDGQLLWTWLCTWWLLNPHTAVADHGALLVDRWERFAADANRVGHPATTEHAVTVADALRRRFRIVGDALPWYPAFQ